LQAEAISGCQAARGRILFDIGSFLLQSYFKNIVSSSCANTRQLWESAGYRPLAAAEKHSAERTRSMTLHHIPLKVH
jgi:hypothetical protein